MDSVEIATVLEALIIRNHPMQGSRLSLAAFPPLLYLHFPAKKTLLLTLIFIAFNFLFIRTF